MKRSARLRLGRSRTSRCHDIFLLCWPSSLRLLSSTLHPSPFCSVTGRAVWVHPRSPQPSGPQLDAADGRHRLEAGGGGGQGIPQLSLSLACAPRRSSGSCRAVLSSPPQVCSHGAPSCYSGGGGGLRQPLLILLQTVSLLVCLDFPSERACLCFLLAPD